MKGNIDGSDPTTFVEIYKINLCGGIKVRRKFGVFLGHLKFISYHITYILFQKIDIL